MKQEDCNQAAILYEDGLIYSSISDQCDVQRAFKEGARWRINSVWHDVSKIPDPMKDCLVCLNDPMRKGWHIGRIEEQGTNKGKWNIYGYFTPALHESITMWAYIEDLI